LHRIKDGDFTLRGLKVDYRSVWEFVHAEELSFKKSLVAGTAVVPTSRGGGHSGPSIKIASSLVTKVPHGRWKTTTFLAALRHGRIAAPWLLEGPIDGDSFRTYIEKVSCRRFAKATSSSWTISAVTKAKPFASSSARPAPSYSSCQNTHPT
jgi:hypothetical protein